MGNRLNKLADVLSKILDSNIKFEYNNKGYFLIKNDKQTKILLNHFSQFNNDDEFNELVILIAIELLGLNLKMVKRPLQDENTKPEEVQYPNEKWCVKTSIYREGDGGMKLWFKEIERVNPDVIYLYEIKSFKDKIVNGLNEDDWFEDILYSVRYDFKKFSNETKIEGKM